MTASATIEAALTSTDTDWVDINDWAVNTIRDIAAERGWSRQDCAFFLRQEIGHLAHNNLPHTMEGMRMGLRLRRAHTIALGAYMKRTPRKFKKMAFMVWVSRTKLGY